MSATSSVYDYLRAGLHSWGTVREVRDLWDINGNLLRDHVRDWVAKRTKDKSPEEVLKMARKYLSRNVAHSSSADPIENHRDLLLFGAWQEVGEIARTMVRVAAGSSEGGAP